MRKKWFVVEVYELHAQTYRVRAASKEAAAKAALEGKGELAGDPSFIETADQYHGRDDKGWALPDGIRTVEEDD